MIILAIDTSCDDTCISILEIKNRRLEIKSNIVSSQIKIHQKYGGVYPALAKREHQRNLVPILKHALMESRLLNSIPHQDLVGGKIQNLEKILEREKYLFKNLKKFLKKHKKPKIDLIAVTVGPGLEPCLWTGVNFSKAISYSWGLPIIPVNHIEAHILANWLPSVSTNSKFQLPRPRGARLAQLHWAATSKNILPAICLVVSGGHTQLISMSDFAPVVERSPAPEQSPEPEQSSVLDCPELNFVLVRGSVLDQSRTETKFLVRGSLRGYPEVNSVLLRGAKYKILGETRDDAAGECFDKVARILGLGYPGGPAIATEAAKFKAQHQSKARCWTSPAPKRSFWCGVKSLKFKVSFPRPMIHQKNFDFSFSGLKTAVLYDFKNQPLKVKQSKEYLQAVAAEVQQAIIDVLITKTLKAAKEFKAKTIIIGGGVAANEELRKQFKVQSLKSKVNFLVSPKNLCTDNAAMVGISAYFHYPKGEIKNWENIKVDANLRIE